MISEFDLISSFLLADPHVNSFPYSQYFGFNWSLRRLSIQITYELHVYVFIAVIIFIIEMPHGFLHLMSIGGVPWQAYIITFSLGMGSIPWIIMSEVMCLLQLHLRRILGEDSRLYVYGGNFQLRKLRLTAINYL